MTRISHLLGWLSVLLSTSTCNLADDKLPAELSETDKEFLIGLIGKPLTDPTGKQFCVVTVVARDCWGRSEKSKVTGWFQPANGKEPARIYFVDGDRVIAPEDFSKQDFVAETKKLVETFKPKTEEEERDDIFLRMREVGAGSAAGPPNLVRAAWLAKLGHEELAATIMAEIKREDSRRNSDPAKKEETYKRLLIGLQKDLAWYAYADGVHAFMQRADEEGLRHIERLNKAYPEFLTEFGDAKALLSDLRRRQKTKTLGKAALKKPAGFDSWEKMKKTNWLVSQLDQVDARQFGQPGGVHLAGDWRVKELIALGDVAVESLIDVVESDTRLTRSVHFWRDFRRHRTVLSVREAALSAVMSILRVRVFEPASTGDNFTSRGKETNAATVKRLRNYWKKFGKMSFDNRMMAVLTDKKSHPEALREASANLAEMGRNRTLGTTVFSDWAITGPKKKTPNPVIKKFSSPTVAEAILAAMDRDLTQFDGSKRAGDESYRRYRRRRIEAIYFNSLMELDDKRIADDLVDRSTKTKDTSMRRQLALAAHVLGASAPLAAFAEDFGSGKLKLPSDARSLQSELAAIVNTLAIAKSAKADVALMALADPMHPNFSVVSRAVQNGSLGWSDDEVWFRHRYCVLILMRLLKDTSPTGETAVVEKDGSYVLKDESGFTRRELPEVIKDPDSRRESAKLRRCDMAALKISELVIGLPKFHPLLKDGDQRLIQLREVLEKDFSKLRKATSEEREENNRRWGPAYIIGK